MIEKANYSIKLRCLPHYLLSHDTIGNMTEIASPEGALKERYSIPIEQFRQPPQSVGSEVQRTKYNFGERVTRENFISMFMQSFAASRGETAAQWAHLEWLGFDFEDTLQNFSEAGAWDCLSSNEQQEFTDAFNQIGRHYKPMTEGSLERMLKSEIKDDLDELLDPTKRSYYEEAFPNLNGLSRRQLTQDIDVFVKDARIKRRIARYDL